MNKVFENLPEDKQQNIIKCAIKEFAEKGYEQASTNNIVKEAGISKGILFHYFKTKYDLFRYVTFYSVDMMYKEMLELMDFKSNDYFERMLEVSAVKMKIQLEHPEMFDLVFNIFKSSQQEMIRDVMTRYMPLMSEYYQKLNIGIDTSRFKEGMDLNRINEMVTWILEGMSNKFVKLLPDKINNLEELRKILEKEFMAYMDIFKVGVYK